MGMGKSLSASADKGEQLLLLYAPLGKLLKTHYHGYLLRQTTLFSDFLWQQKGPRWRLSSSLFHEEMPAVVPAGQPTSSHGDCTHQPLKNPLWSWGCSAASAWGLLSTALAKPWRRATKNPATAVGGCLAKGLGPAVLGASSEVGNSGRRTGGIGGRAQVYWGGGARREWGALHDLWYVFFFFPFLNNCG